MYEHDGSERPRWLTDELLEHAIKVFQPKSPVSFGESDAVKALVSLSQLLEVTGMLELEVNNEEENVHRMGEGKQS